MQSILINKILKLFLTKNKDQMKQSWNVTELNAFSRCLQYSMHYTHHVAVYVLGLWIQIPFDSQKVCSTPTLWQKKNNIFLWAK